MANIRLRVLPRLIPTDGRDIELQATDTFIQWRYVGSLVWLDLIALSEITGPVGSNIELQSDGTNIQWRAVGDAVWNDLIPLSVITGAPGPEGPPGPAGPGLADGDKGDVVVSLAGTVWQLSDAAKSRIVGVAADRAVLAAMDGGDFLSVDLKEPGRKGTFLWNGSDLSSTMVVRSVTTITVDSAADTIAMRSATTTAVNATTNVATAAAHGFVAGEEVYPTTSVDGLLANGRYYIYFDTDTAAAAGGNVNNFKVRTSSSAPAFDLTATTNFTVRGLHNLLTGQVVIATSAVNGLALNTPYWFIRTDAYSGKLASSYANAIAGTAFNLTGTTNFTMKQLLDPRQGVYVTRTGAALDGSAGAWVRDYAKVEARFFGLVSDYVKGVGGTDNSEAIRQALQFAFFTGARSAYFPAGNFGCKAPFGHWTFTNLAIVGVVRPDNGVGIIGQGDEVTTFYEHELFAGSGLLELDGNYNAVTQTVGSNPMAQGSNHLEGFSLVGRGHAVGATSGLRTRGCWVMTVHNVSIREFGGNGWEVFSAVPAGPPAYDDVDSTGFLSGSGLHISDCGGSGIISLRARVAAFNIKNVITENNLTNGVEGCFINSTFDNLNSSGNGSRSVVTTGGVRLYTSTSGAVCRDVTFLGGIFENNFNFEFNALQALAVRWIGGGINAYNSGDGGGAIANKAVWRIGVGCEGLIFDGVKIADYDNTLGDIITWDVATTAKDIRIRAPHLTHTTSHLRLQSGNDLRVDGANLALAYAITGAVPVDCYENNKPIIATTALTPQGLGLTTAGARTGGAATGVFNILGDWIEFDFDYSQTSHTGTGAFAIDISALPYVPLVNTPVSIYQEGLTYTSTPMAMLQTGVKRILFRQAASASAFANINVPAGAATVRGYGKYRWR